jgi:hypothetical protein
VSEDAKGSYVALVNAYQPGVLYAINDGDAWHIAAFSGEKFHATPTHSEYPRTWMPLVIDWAVPLSCPVTGSVPLGSGCTSNLTCQVHHAHAKGRPVADGDT